MKTIISKKEKCSNISSQPYLNPPSFSKPHNLLSVIHTSVSCFHSWGATLIDTVPGQPFTSTSQQVTLTSPAYPLSYIHLIHPSYACRKNTTEEKLITCDLLSHIHSKGVSSFLWLCHPLTVSPISLPSCPSRASSLLRRLLSNSSSGYPLSLRPLTTNSCATIAPSFFSSSAWPITSRLRSHDRAVRHPTVGFGQQHQWRCALG